MLGVYARALRLRDAAHGVPPRELPSKEAQRRFRDVVRVEPAVEAICARARSKRIVIVNEHHNAPPHRAFGRKLLSCLRDAGFVDFAVEALGEEPELLRARGWVSVVTGFYPREPQMAGLIGDAMRRGFRLVRYETRERCESCSREERIAGREEAQAQNLVNEVFAKRPEAKLFIWVGHGHGAKRPQGPDAWDRWMAARLWEKTRIEPLSIVQTSESFQASGAVFRAVSPVIADERPVFVDIAAAWERLPGEYRAILRASPDVDLPDVDGVVVHPARRELDARHLWLGAPASHRLLIRPRASVRRAYVIQIFAQGTRSPPRGAVPLDQILCNEGEVCEIVAPAGRYFVRVWDEHGIRFDDNRQLAASGVVDVRVP